MIYKEFVRLAEYDDGFVDSEDIFNEEKKAGLSLNSFVENPCAMKSGKL